MNKTVERSRVRPVRIHWKGVKDLQLVEWLAKRFGASRIIPILSWNVYLDEMDYD